MTADAEDLSPAEMSVLIDLARNGRDRVRNVAERTGMHRVTASRALTELTEAGLAVDVGIVVSVYEATAEGQRVAGSGGSDDVSVVEDVDDS